MAEVSTLEEVTAADAVSNEAGIRVVGNGQELVCSLGRKALIGINDKEPWVPKVNLMDAPGSMETFVAAKD